MERGQWNWPDDLDIIGPADSASRARRPALQAAVPFGAVAEEPEVSADFDFVLHNAVGITSVQAGLSVAEALIRLRAHAVSHDRSVKDVVARALRLS